MGYLRTLGAASVAAACAASAVVPAGHAAPFLPVGAGAWAGSLGVGQTAGCKTVTTGTTDCTIFARSKFTTPPPASRTVETCDNATYVVTTPVVIGTNFGCTAEFAAEVRLTGTGSGTSTENPEVEIEAGACAGITLVGPTLTVTDGAAGSYAVPARVTVTSSGWKIQGSYVALDTATTRVVVLDVTATVTPACTAARAANGSANVAFNGVFNGSYQFL